MLNNKYLSLNKNYYYLKIIVEDTYFLEGK